MVELSSVVGNAAEGYFNAGASFVQTSLPEFSYLQTIPSPPHASLQLGMTFAASDTVTGHKVPAETGPKTRVRYATKTDWDMHQALIKRLYSNEKKPLSKVMCLMKDQYGFIATENMYKKRIKSWDIGKKNKEHEMRDVVRKNEERERQGKRSIFRVRGRDLDFAEVLRYWKRKGMAIDDVLAQITKSPTPEVLELPTPIPFPAMTPQVLATPEKILRCIANYATGSFDDKAWVRSQPDSYCYSSKEGPSTVNHMSKLITQCHVACRLFSIGSYREAGETLLAATANIKEMLMIENPDTLYELCYLIVITHRAGRDEIAMSIMHHISDLARIVLGDRHPIHVICSLLGSEVSLDIEDIVVQCMRNMADLFERFLGTMHSTTIDVRLRLNDATIKDRAFRIDMLQDQLMVCERTICAQDPRSLQIREWLAWELLDNLHYVEAMEQGKAIHILSHVIKSARQRCHFRSVGLFITAQCQYALEENDLGILNPEAAIDSKISAFDPNDGTARGWLLNLEEWYVEQGQHQAAVRARQRREKILELLDKE